MTTQNLGFSISLLVILVTSTNKEDESPLWAKDSSKKTLHIQLTPNYNKVCLKLENGFAISFTLKFR